MGENEHALLEKIANAIENGMAAKEVVCSITTGFRKVPSIRTAPGLNPYHASVADIGYGFDSVHGTINRLCKGEIFPFPKEMLVLDLDTLRISAKQLSPNFELAVKRASPDVYHLVEQSRILNQQITETINETNRLGKILLGSEWKVIRSKIKNIQAIPRL
ncbi:hypothetical protein KHA93_07065 [Bacillus sp. FJAT-49732]|uniref:Uncharacterized protein n=1 Tax=Lederbergia citrisecunda TaxID=2833583 RepID=A0A942TME3_9BACI|nr:hypothetical protein [Lederbergia citrisecunda]